MFWLRGGVFGKEARSHHTSTHAKHDMHLVSVGHANTKLGVEAGLEHEREQKKRE